MIWKILIIAVVFYVVFMLGRHSKRRVFKGDITTKILLIILILLMALAAVSSMWR